MKSRPVISIMGWYGEQNVGDEALLAGIIGQLKKHLDQPSLGVFSATPEDTAERHGVEAFYKFPDARRELFNRHFLWNMRTLMWQGLRQLSRSDAVLIGGGGIIADHYPNQLNGQLWRMEMALRHSPLVATYGVGVAAMQSDAAGARLARTMNRLPMIAVRDQESADELAKWGIRKNVLVSADPALTLSGDASELPEDIYKRLHQRIVVCPVHRFKGTRLKHYGEWHRDALNGLQASLESPVPVVLGALFPGDEGIDAWLQSVPGYEGVQPLYNISPRGVVEALGQAALVFSTRLHGTILGIAAGARVAPVIYDVKVKGLVELAGLQELATEYGDGHVWTDTASPVEELTIRLKRALNTAPINTDRLNKLRQRAELQAVRLKQLLDAHKR